MIKARARRSATWRDASTRRHGCCHTSQAGAKKMRHDKYNKKKWGMVIECDCWMWRVWLNDCWMWCWNLNLSLCTGDEELFFPPQSDVDAFFKPECHLATSAAAEQQVLAAWYTVIIFHHQKKRKWNGKKIYICLYPPSGPAVIRGGVIHLSDLGHFDKLSLWLVPALMASIKTCTYWFV